MQEKPKKTTISEMKEAEEFSQQKKQQQKKQQQQKNHDTSHDDSQENKEQQQNHLKREKKHKRIKQQESRRLQDASRAERGISALQKTLNLGVDDEGEETKTIDIQSMQSETDDEEQETDFNHKKAKRKKKPTKSLSAFSATMASLLAQEPEGGSAVLSQDAGVFENIKTEQAEERIRRELIAERRHKRSLTHRLPSEDNPELEANLKRLATKGTVTFLNVLMAARRRAATESPKKQKMRKRKRFVKRPSDKSKLIASKK